MEPGWERHRQILRCPTCVGDLRDVEEGLQCGACDETYPTSAGQADLRLREPRSRTRCFEFDGEYLNAAAFDFDFEPNPSPAVDWSGQPVPPHLDEGMLSHFPKADGPDARVIDAGCGDGVHEAVCRRAGFDWVGVDFESAAAPVLGDVHALPFADASFDFGLSVAVLSNVPNPCVMLEELHRVLKPGSTFVGTVAFLEPCTRYSHYHHSPLGTLHALRQAGFAVEQLGPGWHGLTALGRRLFPKLPRPLQALGAAPVRAAHEVWYAVGRRVYDDYRTSKQYQRAGLAGSLRFVASAEDGG